MTTKSTASYKMGLVATSATPAKNRLMVLSAANRVPACLCLLAPLHSALLAGCPARELVGTVCRGFLALLTRADRSGEVEWIGRAEDRVKRDRGKKRGRERGTVERERAAESGVHTRVESQ